MKTDIKMDNYEWLSDGMYGTEKTFPPQIQKRIDNGMQCCSSIGKGWEDIVVWLDAEIAKICPDYVVDQCKEKFGGLRYYINVPDDWEGDMDKINLLIHEAETKSFSTCEVCGERGELDSTTGWICIRCPDHRRDPSKDQ